MLSIRLLKTVIPIILFFTACSSAQMQFSPTAGTQLIPIDAKRWYSMNHEPDAIAQLFDSSVYSNIDISWHKLLPNYESYYRFEATEKVTLRQIRFFDWNGGSTTKPMRLFVIDSNWQRKLIATFTGSRWNTWVGPYPDSPANVFTLDTPVVHPRYLVIDGWNDYPSEIMLYGNYLTVNDSSNTRTDSSYTYAPLAAMTGINAFEWDYMRPQQPDAIDSVRWYGMQAFKGFRHYLDWKRLQPSAAGYTFNPSGEGSWNYDTLYQFLQQQHVPILACIKTIPDWLLQQWYPDEDRDHENIPAASTANLQDPASYIEQARLAFQFTARYGRNTLISPALLQVNATPRWNQDPINQVRIGLNTVQYIECDNERDKWWKGRKAYQTGREYAANLSAFYDGHKGALGLGIGVKQADKTMMVVMAGTANPSTDYLHGMIDWCAEHRGFKLDGTVDVCWDVINYHYYATDAGTSQSGNPTRGAAPEVTNAMATAKAFIRVAQQRLQQMPVWVTETGYDMHPQSKYRAIAIGGKSALQTHADWMLRTSLLYAKAGVAKVFFYMAHDVDTTNATQFATSGLLFDNYTRKPAANYLWQLQQLFGSYTFSKTLDTLPVVDVYRNPTTDSLMYAVYMPTEQDKKQLCTLQFSANTTAVRIYKPLLYATQMEMQMMPVSNNTLIIEATETPLFIVPIAAPSFAARPQKNTRK
jgi:hypothetical protein